jgi:glycosyltransferase involved in cell wall biosynthesis
MASLRRIFKLPQAPGMYDMRILFLSSWYPFPADNGSRIRVLNLIKQLSKCHDISLLSFSRDGEIAGDRLAVMQEYCAAVCTVPLVGFRPRSIRSTLGFFSPRPRSFVDTYSRAMQASVEQAMIETDVSVVVASQMDAAPYAAALRNVPRVFEELELTVLQEKYTSQSRVDRRLRYGLMWWKTERFVRQLVSQFDGCTVASQQERANVLRVAPNCQRLAVIPNGVDLGQYEGELGAPQPDTLVFPGALTYDANLDAMTFFLDKVFPLIRAQQPGISLRITGKTDGVPLEGLPLGEGVILTGYLEDVRPTIAQSWACVVPLRVGGGTRLKVLEAMALGTPVVSTSKGAEGLDITPGEHLLVADDPDHFAQCVVKLITDPDLRDRLVVNGRRLVEEEYGWDKIGDSLNCFLQEIVDRRN